MKEKSKRSKRGKSNRAKGVAREYKARDILKANGFYVVRSAGSHGLIDLVAIGFGHVRLIQCKSEYMSKEERQSFERLSVPPMCSKEIWTNVYRKGFNAEYLSGHEDCFGGSHEK